MKTYVVQRWKGDQLANEFGEVAAENPRQAIEQSQALTEMQTAGTGDPRDWAYEDDADGAGSITDPADPDHFIEALPL